MMDISGLSSMINQYTDVYANKQDLAASQLKSKLAATNSSSSDDELMDVCKQFESYFLEQVFKEMMKTVKLTEETDNATSSMVDYFKDMMIQDVAAQSTETNSLGLAQMLYEQMQRNMGMSPDSIPAAKISQATQNVNPATKEQ